MAHRLLHKCLSQPVSLRPLPLRIQSRHLHQSATSKMKVITFPIRSDNYMYLIVESQPSNSHGSANAKPKGLLVDPAESGALDKVREKVKDSVEIVGVLTTHHHEDHAGGNHLIAKAFPSIPIYGGSKKVKAVTNIIKDNDQITLGNIQIKCLATPCHTQDSISYYATESDQKAVFTGDTLFQGGCGRFFEGTPTEMDSSLQYLASLPGNTIVYSGHEYTGGNLKFAKKVNPDNPALARLEKLCEDQITMGKSTIADESDWNVFMRLDDASIRKATGKSTRADVMGKLREMKNAM